MAKTLWLVEAGVLNNELFYAMAGYKRLTKVQVVLLLFKLTIVRR